MSFENQKQTVRLIQSADRMLHEAVIVKRVYLLK